MDRFDPENSIFGRSPRGIISIAPGVEKDGRESFESRSRIENKVAVAKDSSSMPRNEVYVRGVGDLFIE